MRVYQSKEYVIIFSKPLIGWIDRYYIFNKYKHIKNKINIGCGDYSLRRNRMFECKVNVDIVNRKFPNFVKADIFQLFKHFKENQFEIVWCAHVLEHLPLTHLKLAFNNLLYISKFAVILLPDGNYIESNMYKDHLISFQSEPVINKWDKGFNTKF